MFREKHSFVTSPSLPSLAFKEMEVMKQLQLYLFNCKYQCNIFEHKSE